VKRELAVVVAAILAAVEGGIVPPGLATLNAGLSAQLAGESGRSIEHDPQNVKRTAEETRAAPHTH
jgi:hypothetical protein